MYGQQTPMHDGSRTPHYGSATPRYDGSATPTADRSSTSAWDPTSMNTPRNDFEEDWDEQPAPGSASLNPTTPGYQAETPIDGTGMVGIGSVEHRSVGPFTPGSALNYVTHSPYAANPSPLDAYHQHNIFSNQGKSWVRMNMTKKWEFFYIQNLI